MSGRVRVAHRAFLAVVAILAVQGCAVRTGEATDPTRRSFVLVAGTNTLWALEENPSAQPGWLTLRGPGGDGPNVSLRERCEVPECGVEAGVCGRAIPTVARIEPGDSLVWSWDGRASRIEGRAEGTCELRTPAAEGRYTVEACWTEEAPQGGETPMEMPTLVGLRCETREIDVPGAEQVTWGR